MSMAVIGIFASDKGPGDPERASLMSQTGTLLPAAARSFFAYGKMVRDRCR